MRRLSSLNAGRASLVLIGDRLIASQRAGGFAAGRSIITESEDRQRGQERAPCAAGSAAGTLGGAGFFGTSFFPGARVAWSVVPSMRGMNSTEPESPMSWIRRLMMA